MKLPRVQIKKGEMGGACGTDGVEESACRVLVGVHDGKRPLGRPRPRLEDNIKMKL
jgi:hypothetical protein